MINVTSVSIFEAKTNLSKYVTSISEKKEPFIVILRNGKPVARIVPYEDSSSVRIGTGIGIIPPMGSLDDFNNIDIETDFTGNGDLI